MNNNSSKDLEALIESLVHEEVNAAVIEEGLVDAIKSAWQATKGAANQAWGAVQNQLSQSSNALKSTVQKSLQTLNGIYPQVKQQYDFIQKAQQQAGESIQYDDTLRNLQKVATNTKAVASIVDKEAEQTIKVVQQVANQGTPEQQQENIERLNAVFTESLQQIHGGEKQLNEVGITAAVGLGLGSFGGIKLLMHGLHKLFSKFNMPKAQKLASFFHSAHDKLHHIEIATLDKVIPNRVAYIFYQTFSKKFSKKGEPLSFEEFSANESVRTRVKKYIYAVMLLTLFIIGVTHLLHASFNFINAAEGAANTVKAIEVGEIVVDAASTVASAGAEATAGAGELAGIAAELGTALTATAAQS